MNWFTPKRIGILGCVGTAIFFAGFTICKLAGSEPDVSWHTGVFNSLLFGVVVAGGIVVTKLRIASIGKMFYGE